MLDMEKRGVVSFEPSIGNELASYSHKDALLLRERNGRSVENGNQSGQSRPAIPQQDASSTCRRPRGTRERIEQAALEDVSPGDEGYGTRSTASSVGLRSTDVPEHGQHS